MPKTIEVSTNLVTVTCYRSDCGILFAVPELWQESKRRDHTAFCCPNGHGQSYQGKSEEEKLREKLAETEQRLKWTAGRAKQLGEDNMSLARSRSAYRGQVTRLKNQAAAGRCAFCEHEFPDVAAHVAEAHPGVVTEATDEDEASD